MNTDGSANNNNAYNSNGFAPGFKKTLLGPEIVANGEPVPQNLEGQMDAEDAIQSYQSWRAHAKRCDSYRTLEAMDVRFTSMFAPELRRRKNKFPCTLRAKKTKAGWEYTRITQQATQAA